MEINKETLALFREDFAQAVKELESKYNVDISLGGIGYELNNFHCTMNVRKKGLDNAEWNWYCGKYGFTPEDFGKTFIHNHKTYTITGIKKGSKYPIQARREDGKEFGFSPSLINIAN